MLKVILQWIEGNKYAVYATNEEETKQWFLGYHFTSEEKRKADIQKQCEETVKEIQNWQ